MRSAALTSFLCSSIVLALGCGNSGSDDDTSTTQTLPTLPPPTTMDTTDETGSTDPSMPTGGVTDTSASEPPTSTSEVMNTEPGTSTTTTDATTDPVTSNPVTTETTTVPGTDTGDIPCEEIQATLQPVAPNIMLVLDKSGSMVADPAGYWDADNDPATPPITRWNSLYQVVQSIVNANDGKINFGANLFPSKSAVAMYNASACPVNGNPEVPVAAMNGQTILNTIPQAGDVTIKGGTPSAAGMTTALNHLKGLDANVPRAVLLITDGAANCRADAVSDMERFETYDQSLHTIVSDAFTVDMIPTYVIGIDIKNMVSGNTMDGNPNGINPFEKLNELATQGGKPKDDPNEKFYNAVNQLELQAALDAIVGDALSCIIPLDSEPAFPDDTEVKVGGVKVPKVTDCASENGWVYSNPMGPYNSIELCGTACNDLKTAGEADVNFFCSAG